MVHIPIALLSILLALPASKAFADAINAASTFETCTSSFAAEDELHDELVASGWRRETLAFDKELFSATSNLSHEDFSAIFWFSTRLGVNQENDLRYWVEQDFENRDRSDIIVGILHSGFTLYSSNNALLAAHFMGYGKVKSISCNFIGPKSDSDSELMRSLALPYVNFALIRAVRIPNDRSAKHPMEGGFFAIGKQRKMEIAFGREIPELTMFSVRSSFQD